jgi:O-antigen/teichoic acid export membrane protein
MVSRARKSARNIYSGILSKVILFVFAFACRTVFVRLLGAEFTGINGLYSNILNVLSLADLGIANVFAYSLYSCLEEKNNDHLSQLVGVFKKLYILIGMTVFAIGLALVPFLPYIVNTNLPIDRLVLYYVLYLINAAASYFFAYKTIILDADQKQYINSICITISQCVMYLLQVVYLILFRDFVGYLIIQVVCTIGKNLAASRIVDLQYPVVRKKRKKDDNQIETNVISTLRSNIKSTFIYKISTVMLNNTDNILISMILGTVYVGYYSNYYLLIQYVKAYTYIFTSGIQASIGNFQITENEDSSYDVFKALNLLYAGIGCVLVCAFANCIQEFIPIWVGKEYLISNASVFAILLTLYIDTISNPIYLYRETLGLFREVRYIMIPAAVINIVLSIILGKMYGLFGILFATSIARLLTSCWYEPIVICKRLGQSVEKYFITQLKYGCVTVITLATTYVICQHISGSLMGIVCRVGITIILALVAIIVTNYKSKEFETLKNKFMIMLHFKTNKTM